MAVTVTITNLAVPAMHEQFAVLILSNPPRLRDGIGLSAVNCGDPAVASSTNSPPARVRHDVLILSHLGRSIYHLAGMADIP